MLVRTLGAVAPLVLLIGCAAPQIVADCLHPDGERQITFTAGRGDITDDIAQMQIEVDGSIVATTPGDWATFTGGPYSSYANRKLRIRAIATLANGSQCTTSDWVYIADARNDFGYAAANGSNGGYPANRAEETGPNLYRLDKPELAVHGWNALAEYADWMRTNPSEGSESADTPSEVQASADHLVAAVARYVHTHMDWRSDEENAAVFSANGFDPYDYWEFPQPADLTLSISGDPSNGNPKDDFLGDCEDHSILRAALLRVNGFAPWAIWSVNDDQWEHEYNIVLYEGAFRLMDYGPIDYYLDVDPTSLPHDTYYGWNESEGSRLGIFNHMYLVNSADNYPGGKSDGQPWSHRVYYRTTSP